MEEGPELFHQFVKGDVLVLEGVVDGQPVDLVLLDLPVDPVLDAGELGDVLEVLQGVHVEEVVPQAVHIVDVGHEVLASPLEGVLVGKADVALAVPLVLDLLLGVPLLGELVNNDGGDDVAQQDLEKAPVD